ncbi:MULTISPECIES: glutamyl-Q tRNA(Asp) synthetase [Sphingomonas]|uniref:glutamyl-Q tRNA(Asp) synthetase n=1 Tax=Sphingomonas TaxID=13687 RepID=UPI0009620D98|nr:MULTISPECIES: glutamyl-Q tRNA(Asp) synthetase [unclassified Sphingomonas]MBN8809734.1 glutamyl-Q tRNA(Asp) synthetase [Sphingomonas sp.]OJY50370.1 MAG: tRNA glutamyl-Q(34) synthetase GluQRS [Sphingomonas sp. 67-41]
MVIHTRFAPSPTGRLHLGHAWSAIQAHDHARAHGGRFTLRIEDIDGTRSRPEHVEAILRDLEWLGLGWDGAVTWQSRRLHLYEAALGRLRGQGLLYPCFCTRADIAASLTAPHGPEGALYPGTCRGREAPDLRRPHCWRLDMARALKILPGTGRGTAGEAGGGGGVPRAIPDEERPLHQPAAGPPPRAGEDLWWHDAHAGRVRADPAAAGDVVLARKDAPASYHLAVTVDDAAQGITDVVRGVDLFAATHVHRLLQALLGLPTPEYRHHPLLAGPDGTRLAKRHGAPSLEAMRLAGEDGRALAERLRAGQLPVGIAATGA